MSTSEVRGQGTKEDPWILKTPPGKSEYLVRKDEEADLPALMCKVGSTVLGYQLRCLDDLHTMLKGKGDWVELGSKDEGKDPKIQTNKTVDPDLAGSAIDHGFWMKSWMNRKRFWLI